MSGPLRRPCCGKRMPDTPGRSPARTEERFTLLWYFHGSVAAMGSLFPRFPMCNSSIICSVRAFVCFVQQIVLLTLSRSYKSGQFQISPAASPEILHHTLWRTWLFIAYSDERWLYYQFSLPHLYILSLEGWEKIHFELGSERVNNQRYEILRELLDDLHHFETIFF